MRRALLLLAILLATGLEGQFQPESPVDSGQFTVREDLAAAGDLAGAERIVRFVQVSDAHIVDDDAPFPVRQETVDNVGYPIDGGQRTAEEYSDEILNSAIAQINAIHAEDALDFVINTGDNIDNQLENELMRFIDNWEGTLTRIGPVSGKTCVADGQSENVDDSSQDVVDACTHLPATVADANTPLAPGLPWYSAFGNHDGMYQGNTPQEPSYQESADEFGRRYIDQTEYVDMHFPFGKCVNGQHGGDVDDDFGHGYGYAGDRLCDDDPDNDGYYSFTVRGVAFIVLDTLNDDWANANENLAGLFVPQQQVGYDTIGGYAEGAIDPVQWAWLQETLNANAGRPVIVSAHHTVNSMFSKEPEKYCSGGQCLDQLLRASGFVTGPELTEELASHPNVLAFVGGHTHQHRIQAKQTADGAFWNIETSSLLDWPQEPRIIEVWRAPDGKWFLATQSFTHDFQLGAETAFADPQRSPTARGEAEDQNVILWLDAPADLEADPQPVLPRVLRMAPSGETGRVGEPYTFTVAATDVLREESVAGLNLTVDIGYPDGATLRIVVPAGTPLVEQGNGTYALEFTPTKGSTHFATVVATDNGERYEQTVQVFSIAMESVAPSKGTPGVAVPLLLAAVFLLRRR